MASQAFFPANDPIFPLKPFQHKSIPIRWQRFPRDAATPAIRATATSRKITFTRKSGVSAILTYVEPAYREERVYQRSPRLSLIDFDHRLA